MSFHLSLPPVALEAYILALLGNHIPDGQKLPALRPWLNHAIDRTEFCFSRINCKYFCNGTAADRQVLFSHLNGDHMSAFLYFLGNTIWNESHDEDLPTRLFYLNKILHGIDLYFSVRLPDIFRLVHPVGTVLGNAEYGNYFVAYQNCSVGADEAGIYPRFSEGVTLYSKSSVLGNCEIGRNVVFAANSFVINTDIPDHSVVVGQHPNTRILGNKRDILGRFFLLPELSNDQR